MKRIDFTVVLLIVMQTIFSQTWISNPANSRLGFTIPSMAISHVNGNFNKFNVKVVIGQPDYSDAQIEVVAQIESLNTGVNKRDRHLKSKTFFDVEQFPTLKFISSSLKKVKDKTYKITGNLLLHGITKRVVLDVNFSGKSSNPKTGKEIADFKVTGHLNRADFGIGSSYPNLIIGNDVTIKADLELNLEN